LSEDSAFITHHSYLGSYPDHTNSLGISNLEYYWCSDFRFTSLSVSLMIRCSGAFPACHRSNEMFCHTQLPINILSST